MIFMRQGMASVYVNIDFTCTNVKLIIPIIVLLFSDKLCDLGPLAVITLPIIQKTLKNVGINGMVLTLLKNDIWKGSLYEEWLPLSLMTTLLSKS